MNWKSLCLIILGVIILSGWPSQPALAQKKGNKIIDNTPNLPPVKKIEGQKVGKRGVLGNEVKPPQTSPKMPPRQLLVEVKITGGGSSQCPEKNATATCTWSIDRTYTTTAFLNQFIQMPLVPGLIQAHQKPDAFKQAIASGAFSPRWTTLPTLGTMDREVEVTINDSMEVTWIEKHKKVVNGKDVQLPDTTKTTTHKWTANKSKGLATNFAEVTLDRAGQAFKVRVSLNSNAQMTFTEENSWTEVAAFPKKMEVFPVPEMQNGFKITEPTIAFEADAPDPVHAAFDKTFPSLKPKFIVFDTLNGLAEKCTVTVRYKFQ